MRTVLRWTLAVAALATSLAAASSAEAVKAAPESYAAFQKQVSARQVQTATVSPAKHTVRVKLRSGRKYLVSYPAAQQAPMVASLKAAGAKVHVDHKKKSSGGLRLRYIVLIVVVVLAIAAGAAYLIQRRRSPRP